MSLETDLIAALKTVCPRVFVETAPHGTQMPYLTWQRYGGKASRYLDNTAPDWRNAYVQISAWAETSRQAFSLLASVEFVLCEAPAAGFHAAPKEEASSAFSEDDAIRGAQQDFDIWGERS